MAGRWTASETQLRPDPRFGNKTLARFINCIMQDGKKSVAQRVVYDAMDEIKTRIEKTPHPGGLPGPLEVFEKAIENAKPYVEVRSKRVGGANYQVPVEVSRKRQRALAFRWILESAREKKGKPLHRSLAEELLAAFNREGGAMAKRDNTHKMAEANKAFAHYRW